MSYLTRLLVFIFCLFLMGIGWAANQLFVHEIGLSGDVGENVHVALDTEKKQITEPIRAEDIQDFYKRAPKIILEAMQPYGYFHPKILSHLSQTGSQWTATFNIVPGPAIHITRITIDTTGQAQNDLAFKKLYEHLPIKTGDILNTDNYEKAKQLIYDLASTRGYFDSKMSLSRIYINLKTNEAQIVIKLESGPRYHFGNTFFSNNPFNPAFLMRFLAYQKGTAYNYHKIEKTQQNFINSNYFSEAIIKPLTDQTTNQEVPIKVNITPRKRFAYLLGAGYGTDTGPRGTFGFEVRRINQYGHQLKTLIQGSTKNSFANVTYFIPGRHPASDLWTLTTGYANFDQILGNGNSFKMEGGYTTSFGKWKQTLALTYLNERYNLVGFPFTKTQVLYPNLHFQYTTINKTLYPKKGFSLSGFLGGTPGSASTNNFFQARVDVKALFTLFDSTRFVARASFARTQIDSINNLPFSLQLFAGGARSIRGYRYNQIGPGRNLFVGSIEIQQRIKGNFYLVGFFDAGNVTDDNPFKNLNEGVGPGIAWLSPIGLLEITVANAITSSNKPWLIQFTMGPEI